MTHNRRQSGFTLIELMVVVALIGVLAAIAVPTFAGESRKSKGDSEVNAFFAELRVREEQYSVENGLYLPTGTAETTTFPAVPSASAQPLGLFPTAWKTLKVHPPESSARCGYVVMAGTKTTAAGPMATAQFGFVVPAKNWFYVLAHCNLDGNSAKDSYYFVSSESETIQKLNYGK